MNPTHSLQYIYETLHTTYGPQHWWPADTPFEVALGAILTQNTSWTNVEKAMAGLREVCDLTAKGILSLHPDNLEQAIRPSGYFRQKAKKLQIFCHFLLEQWGGDLGQMSSAQTSGVVFQNP
jgi:endonuclease-3 related protein